MREAVRPDRELSGQSHIAVLRGVVLLGQPTIVMEQLPPVGDADETDRTREERLVGGHRQERAVAFRKQDAVTLVVAAPAGVVGAAVDEMRRRQRKQA